ncbi:C4-dicarboxylate ABC transporter permease [bacterium DOLZORAL124_64_63]|nr:MAG: C4-dicarboxylate ABC transporter permease [bacterium DOLZORAL124_64_63]
MEILQNLVEGFGTLVGSGISDIAWWQPILVIAGGVIIGIFVGVMPGLSASTGVALMVPFTYGMHPLIALILLASVYTASAYGGCITAIAINTPGTPASVALSFDGYALTRKGEPGRALGAAVIANCTGGIVGTFILILFSVPLAKAALAFGPPEYFALAIFGLTIVVSLEQKNMLKGAVSTVLGLLLMTIGLDPINGYMRFTFGRPELADGISFIPALIGLFAVGEVLLNIERLKPVQAGLQIFSSKMPGRKELLGLRRSIVQSSALGTVIGVVPGAGATIAAFIAYNESRRISKQPEMFGQGSLEGVAAPAAAAGGSVGGALIPLLTLGIPGSAATAVLVGALMLHGITPGPELFTGKNSYLVYGLFASLVLGNTILLVLGILGNRLWVKIIAAPKALLFPVILVIAFVGSFGVANSLFDVSVCLTFGIFGWILRRYGFPTPPMVLALILGYMAESNFRRALVMGDASIFLTRPVSVVMLTLAFLSFSMPFIRAWRQKGKERPLS